MRYFQQSKPHGLNSHTGLNFKDGEKDGAYCDKILDTEFQAPPALLMVTGSCLILPVSWDSQTKKALSSLIIIC